MDHLIFFLVITTTTVMALASAWSTQFPQFFHAFAPSPAPTASPLMTFRSFFQQDPLLQPQSRYYVPQPQFRQPSQQFYQPIPVSRVPTPDVHHHHHHHVFYYYYFPADGEQQRIGRSGNSGGGQVVRQPCDDHPIAADGYPPVYLPPQLPSPPTPITTQPPSTPIQSPCNDDTVVVDNVNYSPFGRAPIVVAATGTTGGRVVKDYNGSNDSRRDHVQQGHRPENKSNFILANYLLPPDK